MDRMSREPILIININLTETVRVKGPLRTRALNVKRSSVLVKFIHNLNMANKLGPAYN